MDTKRMFAYVFVSMRTAKTWGGSYLRSKYANSECFRDFESTKYGKITYGSWI